MFARCIPRRTLLSAFMVSIAAASSTARAAGPNDAAAEALFVEAKKLAAQGKYAEACPKFAESNRLDRGAGTLIHLGDCYEKNKQTASAWATYKEAASAAQALSRKDWEKLASQRATALEAKLARITIKVDGANTQRGMKTEVSRDGTTVSQASWGLPIPVDMGSHTVEAAAPGHVAFKTTVTVAKDGESIDVVIPKLEAEPSATAPAAQTPSAPEPKSTATVTSTRDGGSQRTLGLVVGGVGLVGLAVGAVTGLMAIGEANDAKAACPNDGGCGDRGAVDASENASTLGLISTIGFIVGAVGVGAGSVLFFTAPSGASKTTGNAHPRMRLSPTAGKSGGGVSLMGSF